MVRFAAGVWLLCALTIGIIGYVVLLQPARDLAENGVRTSARLVCEPAEDCHHTNPFRYTYTANGRAYEAPLVVGRGGHTDTYEPDTVVITYSSTDPRRWTFGSAASNYSDAIIQTIIVVVIGATLAAACICAYVQFGAGNVVTAGASDLGD